MKSNFKNNIKASVIFGLSAMVLVGCGSSSEEDQLVWIQNWNNSLNVEAKMKMLNTCFKEAGVKSMTMEMTDAQNQIVNQCELDYVIELAEKDGINLDRELLAANTLQL
ncbi:MULTISPECIES: hypothetical protein [unclassified Shewanella]|uniref:hypothetical protein n=1 Tax=unclassified Shewanella TaxID=196818 RepID=UPI000C8348C4|nr:MULTISPECIES: hypothetical protein [unclassified Shewanella]MDO6639349.1 hypothetical protein [Shewanella sp. 5_MG-2023]MDO6774819.1 hypothetical protein [Shewanella sp. 3_MG-2023]PMG51124.1 hypothetical protein BCU91_16870 [Shewanella sp. 10N.286.52.B9]